MDALARGTSPEPEEAVPMTPLIVLIVVVILAVIVFFASARIVRQYERGVVLRVGEETALVGTLAHPVDTTTVVGNLLDNAIDAAADTSHAQPPVVELDLLRDGHDLVIVVTDTGAGFTVDDPFLDGVTTRLDPTVPGGRGMGLTIARQVARGHGGDVVVAARGGGTDGEPTTVLATIPGGVLSDDA